MGRHAGALFDTTKNLHLGHGAVSYFNLGFSDGRFMTASMCLPVPVRSKIADVPRVGSSAERAEEDKFGLRVLNDDGEVTKRQRCWQHNEIKTVCGSLKRAPLIFKS